VLERHPSLLEEFIGMSPEFGRLRNPHLRRVMGKLVTVGDAAKIAGIDAGELLGRLNSAIGEEADAATEQAGGEPGRTASHARDESRKGGGSTRQNEEPATLPSSANAGEDGVIVDLDVREDLRSGREPFSRIMAAVATVPPGGTLRLRATFEPVPLYAVL